MKTVVSRTGVEVLYPCSVHLLDNGQILECEYKSDHTGRDLLDYICEHANLQEKDLWGLKFVDIFDQRHWLDHDKLIRTQVKDVCPIHFHFRVKVYPTEPYKLLDEQTRYQIFMQLRLDLLCGRLGCGPSDAALLLALVLQYTEGDFDEKHLAGNYIKSKILLNQSFATEMKAIDLHRNHLYGLSQAQTQDLFLRMACQLETYGIDPYLVTDLGYGSYNLWINHKGMVTYVDGRKVHVLEWMAINRIDQEENKLKVDLVSGDSATFLCLTKAECTYIYQGAVAHLMYFTSTGAQSTIGLIGNESMEELEADIKSFEGVESIGGEIVDMDKKIRLQKDGREMIYSRIYLASYHPRFWCITIFLIMVTIAVQLFFPADMDVFGLVVVKNQFTSLIRKHFVNKLILYVCFSLITLYLYSVFTFDSSTKHVYIMSYFDQYFPIL